MLNIRQLLKLYKYQTSISGQTSHLGPCAQIVNSFSTAVHRRPTGMLSSLYHLTLPLNTRSETFVTIIPNYAHLAQLPDNHKTLLLMEKVGCLARVSSSRSPNCLAEIKWRHDDMSAVNRLLRYVASTITVGQTYCTYGLPFILTFPASRPGGPGRHSSDNFFFSHFFLTLRSDPF